MSTSCSRSRGIGAPDARALEPLRQPHADLNSDYRARQQRQDQQRKVNKPSADAHQPGARELPVRVAVEHALAVQVVAELAGVELVTEGLEAEEAIADAVAHSGAGVDPRFALDLRGAGIIGPRRGGPPRCLWNRTNLCILSRAGKVIVPLDCV